MKFQYKYPVAYASLHQVVQIHGIMQVEKTISPEKVRNAKFFWTDMGLIVEHKEATSLIPAPNVAMVVLQEEPKEQDDKKQLKGK